MTTLYQNFLAGTITDNPLSAGATTVNSTNFANLPVVTGGDIMYLVLDPEAGAGAPEVVTVTAHSSSATSVTATRGAQGSSARSHASGTVWRAAFTKADADQLAAIIADGAIDTANLAAGAVTTAKIDTGAVDTDQLAADSVTTAKIDTGAVDTAELADDAVTTAKIDAGAVDTTEIADRAITPVKVDGLAATFGRPTNITATASTTDQPITFENESNDNDGWWSSGSTFTCPRDGWYLIACTIQSTSGYAYPTIDLSTTALDTDYLGSTGGSKSHTWMLGYFNSGESLQFEWNNSNVSNSDTIQNVFASITRIA